MEPAGQPRDHNSIHSRESGFFGSSDYPDALSRPTQSLIIGGCFLGDGATSLFRGVCGKFYIYLSYFAAGHPVVMKIQKRRESICQSQHPFFTQ